VGVTNEKLAL